MALAASDTMRCAVTVWNPSGIGFAIIFFLSLVDPKNFAGSEKISSESFVNFWKDRYRIGDITSLNLVLRRIEQSLRLVRLTLEVDDGKHCSEQQNRRKQEG